MKNWQFITLIALMVAIIGLTLYTETRIDSLHSRIDSLSGQGTKRIDSLNARLDARFDGLNSEISKRADTVNQRIDGLYGLMQHK